MKSIFNVDQIIATIGNEAAKLLYRNGDNYNAFLGIYNAGAVLNDNTSASNMQAPIKNLKNALKIAYNDDSDEVIRLKMAHILCDAILSGLYNNDNRSTFLEYAILYGFKDGENGFDRKPAFEVLLSEMGPFLFYPRNDGTFDHKDYLLMAFENHHQSREEVLPLMLKHYCDQLTIARKLSTELVDNLVIGQVTLAVSHLNNGIIESIKYAVTLGKSTDENEKQKSKDLIMLLRQYDETQVLVSNRSNSWRHYSIKDYIAYNINPKNVDPEGVINTFIGNTGKSTVYQAKSSIDKGENGKHAISPAQWGCVAAFLVIVAVAITEGAMWNTPILNEFFQSILGDREGLPNENKLDNGKKAGLFLGSIVGAGVLAGGAGWGAAKMRR